MAGWGQSLPFGLSETNCEPTLEHPPRISRATWKCWGAEKTISLSSWLVQKLTNLLVGWLLPPISIVGWLQWCLLVSIGLLSWWVKFAAVNIGLSYERYEMTIDSWSCLVCYGHPMMLKSCIMCWFTAGDAVPSVVIGCLYVLRIPQKTESTSGCLHSCSFPRKWWPVTHLAGAFGAHFLF